MKTIYKKILSLPAVLTLLAVLTPVGFPVVVMANPAPLPTVTLETGSYSYSSGGVTGGEFTAFAGQSEAALTSLGYTNSTIVSVNVGTTRKPVYSYGFQTFCVQTEVSFNPGTSYSYTTGSTTGGTTKQTQGAIGLTEGAAFLYYEFATGDLTGYNYDNTDLTGKDPIASRNTDAGELQFAIWYFMGESIPKGYTVAGYAKTHGSVGGLAGEIADDPFITLALEAFGDSLTKAEGLNGVKDTDYGVEIMQLMCGTDAGQNQLVLTGQPPVLYKTPPTSVPDGGVTLTMLGMGLAGLFFVNFQRTKSVARQN